jgi:hypothetical protein
MSLIPKPLPRNQSIFGLYSVTIRDLSRALAAVRGPHPGAHHAPVPPPKTDWGRDNPDQAPRESSVFDAEIFRRGGSGIVGGGVPVRPLLARTTRLSSPVPGEVGRRTVARVAGRWCAPMRGGPSPGPPPLRGRGGTSSPRRRRPRQTMLSRRRGFPHHRLRGRGARSAGEGAARRRAASSLSGRRSPAACSCPSPSLFWGRDRRVVRARVGARDGTPPPVHSLIA